MHVNWKDGKPHITVNDYTDETDVSLALQYKSKHIKARCEPELFWAAASMITKKRKERFWLGVWQMILAMLPICVISGVVCSPVGNLYCNSNRRKGFCMSDYISFAIRLTPRTKKNSQRIVPRGNKHIPLPSKAFMDYQAQAGWFLPCGLGIDYPVEVTARFYMPTRRIVDLVGLLQGLDDVLVHYRVIADDNSRIIVSHDGSRVLYDKDNPRTEVEIRRIE